MPSPAPGSAKPASYARIRRMRPHRVRFNWLMWRLVRQWFDPTLAGGTPPDYRFSLANERTFLAWIRTALALVGGGLAVAAFVPELRVAYLRETIAGALVLLGAVVAVRAVDHWARSERAMRFGQPLPVSRFPAILAIVIAVGALALFAAIGADLLRAVEPHPR